MRKYAQAILSAILFNFHPQFREWMWWLLEEHKVNISTKAKIEYRLPDGNNDRNFNDCVVRDATILRSVLTDLSV